MTGLYPKIYSRGPIEPIVERVGDNLLLQKTNGLDLYQVQFIDSLPPSQPLVVNLATSGLAAGANTGSTSINLQNQEYMNYGQLGHFRFYVLDPVTVTLWQPQSSGRNLTQLTQGSFTMRTRFHDPNDSFSEHFVYQQNPAYLIATNFNAVTQSLARVAIYGFNYWLAGLNPNTSVNRGVVQQPLVHFNSVNEAVSSKYKFTIVPIAAWGAI
jgi:hypothetical protein